MGSLQSVWSVDLYTTGPKIALIGMLRMLHLKRKRFTLHCFLKPVQECYVENFLGETFSYAILDSRCTKSVCNKVWLQCYFDALNESDKSSVPKNKISS